MRFFYRPPHAAKSYQDRSDGLIRVFTTEESDVAVVLHESQTGYIQTPVVATLGRKLGEGSRLLSEIPGSGPEDIVSASIYGGQDIRDVSDHLNDAISWLHENCELSESGEWRKR